MKKGMVYCLVFFVCLLFVFSCEKKEKEEAATMHEASLSKSEFPLMDKDENDMIASVNDTIITRSDVEKEINNFLMQYQGRMPSEQMEMMRPKIGRDALENLIKRRLLSQEANKQGIQPDSQAVEAHIAKIASRYPSREALIQQLSDLGMTEEILRNDITQNLAIKTLIDNQIPQVGEINEDEIERYYKENPDSFQMPERIKASHILIKVSPDDDMKVREQKRQELSLMREKIINGGDFAELAMEHSECPSKSQGGDLGFFERGKMVKPFEDVAFVLKTGDVSDIVETQFGYHIIKVTERQDAESLPLDEVRDRIEGYLTHQKKDEGLKVYIDELRRGSNIKYAEGFEPIGQ